MKTEISEQEINKAIAEACGWKNDDRHGYAINHKLGEIRAWSALPDFVNDLNAMHEAERVLNSATLCDSYVRYICCIQDWKLPLEANPIYVWMSLARAAAAQRAEAFLRTVNPTKAKEIYGS